MSSHPDPDFTLFLEHTKYIEEPVGSLLSMQWTIKRATHVNTHMSHTERLLEGKVATLLDLCMFVSMSKGALMLRIRHE